MSRQIALDCIQLKHTDRWAHTEYSFGSHSDYISWDFRRITTGNPLPANIPDEMMNHYIETLLTKSKR